MKIIIDTEKKIIFIEDNEGYTIEMDKQPDETLMRLGNIDLNIIPDKHTVVPGDYYVPKTTVISDERFGKSEDWDNTD
ncbi:hypothetical protein ES703_18798 [subsurface metagenome]